MADQSVDNFVKGEASESDDEYEINQSYFMKNTMIANKDSTPPRESIVVEGEASESDENDDDSVEESSLTSQTLDVIKDESHTNQHTKRKLKFHYDSAFHRRLRVCNLELRSDIIKNRTKVYYDANNKMKSALFYLNRSQGYAQDILSNMGLISGDIVAVSDSLDKTFSRDFLPTLKIDEAQESASRM